MTIILLIDYLYFVIAFIIYFSLYAFCIHPYYIVIGTAPHSFANSLYRLIVLIPPQVITDYIHFISVHICLTSSPYLSDLRPHLYHPPQTIFVLPQAIFISPQVIFISSQPILTSAQPPHLSHLRGDPQNFPVRKWHARTP